MTDQLTIKGTDVFTLCGRNWRMPRAHKIAFHVIVKSGERGATELMIDEELKRHYIHSTYIARIVAQLWGRYAVPRQWITCVPAGKGCVSDKPYNKWMFKMTDAQPAPKPKSRASLANAFCKNLPDEILTNYQLTLTSSANNEPVIMAVKK